MGLIYVEFISRQPGTDLAAFRSVLNHVQSSWGDSHAADRLLLAAGRTWRVGPEPEYMFVWHCPGHSFERLDDWEAEFVSGRADTIHEPFKLAARIDRAGCYRPLLDPLSTSHRRYVVHWFEVNRGASADDVVANLERITPPTAELALAVERIGFFGPEPSRLAVWGIPRWAEVGMFRMPTEDDPIRVVTSSLLADIGLEQH